MSNYDDLEFRHLKSMIAIAEEGTFAAAAVRLNIVPSALNRSIRELEAHLRIQIFEPGGAILTPAGESLLAYAYRALPEREEVVDAVLAIHQASMKPFRLGFTPLVDNHVLAIATQVYRDLFPKGSISPQVGDTNDLVERIKAETLDAALVTLPLPPDGYSIQQIMHEPLLVCIRRDDPLAQYDEIPPALLNGKLAIFSDPRHHPLAHERLLEMLKEEGIQSCLCNPTFNAEHLQWMVREGYCLALIPKNEHLHEDLILKPIQGVAWTIDSAVVYRPENDQKALPVFLRDLERRFAVPAQKKPPRSVKSQKQQEELPFTPSSRKRSE